MGFKQKAGKQEAADWRLLAAKWCGSRRQGDMRHKKSPYWNGGNY